MRIDDLLRRDAMRVNALEWEATLGTNDPSGGIPMFFVDGQVLPHNGVFSLTFEFTAAGDIELNGMRIVRRWNDPLEGWRAKIVRDMPWNPPIAFVAGQHVRVEQLIYPEEME